jgi:threonine/homoserine/homoserine lactone efflux protein
VSLVVMFLSSLLIAYSGALMPGPMLTVVVAETPRQGARAGPLVVLGHAILELTLLVLLVIGLGPVLEHEGVQAVLQIAGGLMLVWTAAAMIVALARHRVSVDWEGGADGGKARAVFMGIVSSLANPYWTIWWVTIGLGLLTKAYALGIAGIVVFYLGHITGDLTWYSLVSGALAAGKRYITLGVYRTMLSVAAAFLLVLALWFLTSGVRAAGG